MIKFIVLVLVLLPAALKAESAAEPGPQAAAETSLDIGEGAEFCKKFTSKFKKNDFMIWVQGFFSAFNALDPHTKNIMGNRDFHYALKWLEDYCKANPKQYFGEAVRQLLNELYPSRVAKTPTGQPTVEQSTGYLRFK